MNSFATIDLENVSASFRPYAEVRGTVSWQLEKLRDTVELRLFWHTSGQAIAEAGIVETKPFDSGAIGRETFAFTLPGAPYSVSGTLISIHWALELVYASAGQLALREITVSPDGKPISLSALDQAKKPWWKFNQSNIRN